MAELTGDYLKSCRQSLGITQKEMAQRLGVSRLTIIKYENYGTPLSNILKAYNLEVVPIGTTECLIDNAINSMKDLGVKTTKTDNGRTFNITINIGGKNGEN